jgi:threonine synthase
VKVHTHPDSGMKYVSTRGDNTPRSFCEILLAGLAPDGGLYLPTHYPQIDDTTLTRWRGIYGNGRPGGYADLAFEILMLFIDDIPAGDLRALVHKTYTPAVFGTDAITPVIPIGAGIKILQLSNGPTLAFKDVALQLLGHLFEYELARRGEELNILGATSGDTGSAAEYAMLGKKGIRVFMLSPKGRMSPFQQAQMYSLADPGIHNIAIEGVFDDCQDIVKAVSNNPDFKREYKIGTVNSINWARLLAQVVYYFAGYFQATVRNDEGVSFAIPSGNFGNACSGHIARMMGLPINQLIVATNENDVLDEFFRTGHYRVRSAAETHETTSPSMDISKASNFERFMFDLLGRDGTRVAQLFGPTLARDGQFTLTPEELTRVVNNYGFTSGRTTEEEALEMIRLVWTRANHIMDPHTAVAMNVTLVLGTQEVPVVVLETAKAVKFDGTITQAIGRAPVRPAALIGIEDLPQHVVTMAVDALQVQAYIAHHCR